MNIYSDIKTNKQTNKKTTLANVCVATSGYVVYQNFNETLEIHRIDERLPVLVFFSCIFLCCVLLFSRLHVKFFCKKKKKKKKEIPQNCVDDLRPGCDTVLAIPERFSRKQNIN